MRNSISVRALWDDDDATIRIDYKTDKLKVKVTTPFYKELDPQWKLDFMLDMQRWCQEEVDRIHEEELTKAERFEYTYMKNLPKSSQQLNEEEESPNLEKKRDEIGADMRLQNQIAIEKVINIKRRT